MVDNGFPFILHCLCTQSHIERLQQVNGDIIDASGIGTPRYPFGDSDVFLTNKLNNHMGYLKTPNWFGSD